MIEQGHFLMHFAPTLVGDKESWREDAACLYVDPDMMFPDAGESAAQAKKVCATCPVVEQCLAYSLDHAERYGVWGGRTEHERRKLRTSRYRDPMLGGRMEDAKPRIAELHQKRMADWEIARVLGLARTTVTQLRNDLGLPSMRQLAGEARKSA